MTELKLKELADEFIETLKERAYGKRGYSNELEGDYGYWIDWRNALVEFYLETTANDSSKNVQS